MIVSALGNGNMIAVSKFQEKFGLVLPADYIEFLIQMNGAISKDDTVIAVDKLGESIEIDSLFGICSQKTWLDLASWLNKYAHELPRNSLIIGCDLLNNLIIMITAGENAGIYYWDCSFSFPVSDNDSNAYYLADSFHDFQEKLGGFIERDD